MRRPLDADRVRKLMRELGRAAKGAGRVYLTGGTSAVLVRYPAIDADVLRRKLEAFLSEEGE